MKPFRKTDTGASVVDALIAIVLTSLLSVGVLLLLRGGTGRILGRMSNDVDLWRFVQLHRDVQNMARSVNSPWWGLGPTLSQGPGWIAVGLTDDSEDGGFRLSTEGSRIVVSEKGKGNRQYNFRYGTPRFEPEFDLMGSVVGLRLYGPANLSAVAYHSSRPLWLPPQVSQEPNLE